MGKKKTAIRATNLETNAKQVRPFVIALFFAGPIALLFEIIMYRQTVVSFWLPFSAFILTGVITQPIAPPGVKENLKIVRLFYCTLVYGGLFLTILMAVNYCFLSSTSETREFPVQKTGFLTLPRSFKHGPPFAIVTIDGIEKMVTFPKETALITNNRVMIETRKGLLGFDVIVNKALAN